jgi:peptidoglycan hydrolase-like protein with peptidoglycan-binding domain
VWIAGGVIAAIIIGAVATRGGDETAEADPEIGPINTAEVVVTDLVQEVSLDGTLGTVAADPIVSTVEGIVTGVAATGSTVAEAETLYRVDDEPVVVLYGDAPTYRDLALGSDTMTVSAAGTGVVTDTAAPGSILEQGDVAYSIDGQPVIALYGTIPAYRTLQNQPTHMTGADVAQLERGLASLGHDLDGTLTIDDEFTDSTRLAVEDWQEALGVEVDGSVQPADVVFVPGPSQIVDLTVTTGDTLGQAAPVMSLATGWPMSGADVEQLEQALDDLGHDAAGSLEVDGVFTAETRQAILDMQTAVGQQPDGVVNLGDAVFLPGPIRVEEQLAAAGSTVMPGAPVVAISSSEQVVRVAVPAADQALTHVGDPVMVVLPTFDETTGTVTAVSTTATVDQEGETLFEAIVTLDDPTVAGDLNEAPVEVKIAGNTETGVLAVPVGALLALTEGGYAVEVETAGGYQLVPVDAGFFADGLVAVTSDSLSAGDVVTIP